MTTTPPDPRATQHDGTRDPDDQAPVDAQTLHLREENRALRELLAAQVQASMPRPSLAKRLAWWLISAPGAALVGWRSLLGREDAEPMTGKRMGYATLTVLYTLAIYGALVLLVVSWSTPNAARSGVNAAGPVRVPLGTPPASGADSAPARSSPTAPGTAPSPATGPSHTDDPADPGAGTEPTATGTEADAGKAPASDKTEPATGAPAAAPSGRTPADPESTVGAPAAGMPAAGMPAAGMPAPTSREPASAPAAAPKSTLRITEIPAENPRAWVDSLKAELARCATLGFFERPGCAWTARKQFCETNQGWGAIKECPTQQ